MSSIVKVTGRDETRSVRSDGAEEVGPFVELDDTFTEGRTIVMGTQLR